MRAVRCPQGGDGLPVLLHIVEMGSHHVPKHTLATMGRCHRHGGGPATGDLTPGHGHLQAVGAGGADHLSAVEPAAGAVEGEETENTVVSVRRIESEDQAHGPPQIFELVGPDGPNLGHQVFGAIRRLPSGVGCRPRCGTGVLDFDVEVGHGTGVGGHGGPAQIAGVGRLEA